MLKQANKMQQSLYAISVLHSLFNQTCHNNMASCMKCNLKDQKYINVVCVTPPETSEPLHR